MPAGTRPDILIVIADQLVPSALPFHGDQVTSAPAHDRAGARPASSSTPRTPPSPLCAPARASLMTGLLPSRTGTYDNAAAFSSEMPTFAHYLRERRLPHRAGRQDALLRPRSAARLRGAADHRHLPGGLRLDARLGRPGAPPALVPRHVVGRRRRAVRPVQPARLRRRGGVRAPSGAALDHIALARRPPRSASSSRSRIRTTRTRSRRSGGTSTATRTSRCRLTATTRGVDAPHERAAAPGLRDGRRRARPTTRCAPPGAPTAARSPTSTTRSHRLIGRAARHWPRRRHGRRRSPATTATCSASAALWYKMSFFEGSARVPLVVSARRPAFAPHRVPTPVSTMDLLPTLVDLANDGDRPASSTTLDGRSLLPATCGDAAIATRSVAEYLAEGAIAPIVMVRRGRHKLVHSPADPDQLYDLVTDPVERSNLAGDPLGRAAGSSGRRSRPTLGPCGARPCVRLSQRRRRAVSAALSIGTPTPWDYAPAYGARSATSATTWTSATLSSSPGSRRSSTARASRPTPWAWTRRGERSPSGHGSCRAGWPRDKHVSRDLRSGMKPRRHDHKWRIVSGPEGTQ